MKEAEARGTIEVAGTVETRITVAVVPESDQRRKIAQILAESGAHGRKAQRRARRQRKKRRG